MGLKGFMPGWLARARNNGRMRPINLIVIHCSASPNEDSLYRGQSGKPNFRNPAQTIDEWHAARGFHRDTTFRSRQEPNLSAIGYHYVIDRSGLVLCGRHVDEIGAHAKNFNTKSIGICLVGMDQFSPAQWNSLAHLVTCEVARVTRRNGPNDRVNPLTRGACVAWAEQHGIRIAGHRDLPNVHKTCPGFDVAAWLENGMEQGSTTGAANA